MKKKKIGDGKNRDAKVLEWLHKILNDGRIYSYSSSNFSNYNSHRLFDEVNVSTKLRKAAAHPIIW